MKPLQPHLRALRRTEKRMQGRFRLKHAKTPVYDAFFKGPGARYAAAQLAEASDALIARITREYILALCMHYIGAPQKAAAPKGRDQARKLMGLAPDADEAQIKKRFRALAKQAHPDMGGDAQAFNELMEQYERLMRAARR